jgi:uncharacterized oligopeptide transporter (OPT) family protein
MEGSSPAAAASPPPGVVIRSGPYPELTWPGVLTGYLLGALIGLSIGYAALILGFSIEGSELAAILGFGILRGLAAPQQHRREQRHADSRQLGQRRILRHDVLRARRCSSWAGTDFDPILLTFGCVPGSFLGIAFIIPLRKQMIDFERLTYPGGVAVATILKSPGAGVRKALLLLIGPRRQRCRLHFVYQLTGVSDFDLGSHIGMPDYMNGIWYLSLLTMGVGFIAGKGGVAFIIGGFVCYWFLSPLLAGTGMLPPDPAGGQLTDPTHCASCSSGRWVSA